ncbi:hypothetical protein C464_11063 [Halorubrum coriense DSM 10284]|uniref:Halobacterial output domain-containing protein n=1 Tax=Halorubrum coriense DSM 10284 TaxID=1227466 RepID=M0EF10_9EURY|nr:HalOD1 output domain-containing protein [Halorubrum coriense]ELZ46350.1 hypothetical protein C464_11063 [Halorubrum coriense DSM 10284]
MSEPDRDFSKQIATGSREFRETFDWESTPPSTGVVEVVSDATGREPLALPQLYGVVDSDAMDSLFRSSDADPSLTFAFADCEVTVSGDGEVVVRPDVDSAQ